MPDGDPISNVPIRQPDFDLNATNLSQEFTTFRRICTSLLEDGPYSELSGKQKVASPKLVNCMKNLIIMVRTKTNCLMC